MYIIRVCACRERVCVYLYIYAYIYVCIYVCVYFYIYAYTYMCIHMCICTYVIYWCICTRCILYQDIHIYIIEKYIYTYILQKNIYTHTYYRRRKVCIIITHHLIEIYLCDAHTPELRGKNIHFLPVKPYVIRKGISFPSLMCSWCCMPHKLLKHTEYQ